MPKEKSDALFQLIRSLKKSEKRYFRLQSKLEDPNAVYLVLFDLMEGMEEYDEMEILKRNQRIKAQQFSNLKAHLYKKVLQCIRQYSLSAVMDIQIRK